MFWYRTYESRPRPVFENSVMDQIWGSIVRISKHGHEEFGTRNFSDRRGRFLMSTAFQYCLVIACTDFNNVCKSSLPQSKGTVIDEPGFWWVRMSKVARFSIMFCNRLVLFLNKIVGGSRLRPSHCSFTAITYLVQLLRPVDKYFVMLSVESYVGFSSLLALWL